jgi:hypothetical protein
MAADSDTLRYVGDLSGPVVLAGQSPSGPDAAARWTIGPPSGGSYSAATLVFEKCNTAADYAAENWTPLTVVRQDTLNVLPNGTASGLTNVTLDLVAPSLYAMYAIRARLSAIGAGSISVQVVTSARSLTDPSALQSKIALELTRMRVGLSQLVDVDLGDIAAADGL